MTDLTRERLAELRGIAEKASPGPWSRCGEKRGGCECGYVFGYRGEAYIAKTLTLADDVDPVTNIHTAKANQEYIATLDPTTVLTLIAQCEAGLPASGGVSGEEPMIDAKIALALSDAERALADALGLLRIFDEHVDTIDTWERVRAFLAKHGPSP